MLDPLVKVFNVLEPLRMVLVVLETVGSPLIICV